MNPFYLNPPSLPPEEGNQTQDHLLLTPTTPTSSSSCPIYFNSTQNEGNYDEDHHHQHHQKHKFNSRFWTVEPGETLTSLPTMDNHCYNSRCIKQSVICKRDDQYGDPCDNAPINLESNVRLMRKMANSDRTVANNKLISDAKACSGDMRSRSWDHEKSNNSINSVIRVCADCNTTKTPLWRSGPRGPKSLCNACGIRQRKARRALANGGLVPIEPSMSDKASKEKKLESHCTTQQKKPFKRTKNKLRLEDFTISLSKSLAFHPQDERDAAILLMALSYGLVCS